MPKRYVSLRMLKNIFAFIGYGILVVALLAIVFLVISIVFSYSLLGDFAGQNSMVIQSVFLEVLIASGALTALLFIGFSEAAKALLDTEENTRAILQVLRDPAQHR